MMGIFLFFYNGLELPVIGVWNIQLSIPSNLFIFFSCSFGNNFSRVSSSIPCKRISIINFFIVIFFYLHTLFGFCFPRYLTLSKLIFYVFVFCRNAKICNVAFAAKFMPIILLSLERWLNKFYVFKYLHISVISLVVAVYHSMRHNPVIPANL